MDRDARRRSDDSPVKLPAHSVTWSSMVIADGSEWAHAEPNLRPLAATVLRVTLARPVLASRLLQNGPSSRPAATPRLTLPRRPATRAWSSDAPWSGPRGTLPHSIQCRAGTRRRPRWGAGAEAPPQPSAVSGAVSMGQSRRAVIGTVLPRATRGTDRRACHPHRSSREARAQRACVGGRSWGEAAATARRARPLVPQAGT